MNTFAFEIRNGEPDGEHVDGDTSHGLLTRAICEFMLAETPDWKLITTEIGLFLESRSGEDGGEVVPHGSEASFSFRTIGSLVGGVSLRMAVEKLISYLNKAGCQGVYVRVGADLCDNEEVFIGGASGDWGPVINRQIEFM